MPAAALNAVRPVLAGRRAANRGRLQVVASTAVPAEYKKVEPVGTRVVVEVDKAESTSAGGILLPTAAQVKSTKGKVISAGKGTTLTTGAAVTYSKYAGTEVSLGDKELVILKEDDVIGVLGGGPDDWAKLQPLGDRVLLQAVDAIKETAGGVILASDEVERPTLGKVIAVGPGKAGEDGKPANPPSLTVGSTVLYSKYAGTEFKNPRSDEEFVVVSASDVLATVA